MQKILGEPDFDKLHGLLRTASRRTRLTGKPTHPMPTIRATARHPRGQPAARPVPASAHAQRAGNIGGCDIRRGTLCTNLNLNGGKPRRVNLANSQFTRSDLSGANLRGATLNEASFSPGRDGRRDWRWTRPRCCAPTCVAHA